MIEFQRLRIEKQKGSRPTAIFLFLGSASYQLPERWFRQGMGEEKGATFSGSQRVKAGLLSTGAKNSNHVVSTFSSMLLYPSSLSLFLIF